MKMLGSGACVGIVRSEDAAGPPPGTCQGPPHGAAVHFVAIAEPMQVQTQSPNMQGLNPQAPYHLRRQRHSRAQPIPTCLDQHPCRSLHFCPIKAFSKQQRLLAVRHWR